MSLPPHRGRLQPNPSSLLEAHARGPLRLMTRTTIRMRSPRGRRCLSTVSSPPFTATSDPAAQCLRPHAQRFRCAPPPPCGDRSPSLALIFGRPHTPTYSPRARSRVSMYKPSRFSSTRSQAGPLPIADAALVACHTRTPSLNDGTSSLDCVSRHAHPALRLRESGLRRARCARAWISRDSGRFSGKHPPRALP
jgi:hypothetical protein